VKQGCASCTHRPHSEVPATALERSLNGATSRAASERMHVRDAYVERKEKTNSVALVRKQTIPTERRPLVGEVSANFCA
jgi:hypothetical protein